MRFQILLLASIFSQFLWAGDSFPGTPEAVTIVSTRIFEEQQNGENERVTEICFNLKTTYQNLKNLSYHSLLGDYQEMLGEDLNSVFVELPGSAKPGFIYNLNGYELQVGFELKNSSFEEKSVDYINGVFSKNFNTERKNGQISYLDHKTGQFDQPADIKFCEVYFFNNVITPESFIEFLLTQDTIGFLKVEQIVSLDIKFVRTDDGAIITRFKDEITIDIDIPIAGLGVSSAVKETLSLDIKNAVVRKFNERFLASKSHHSKQYKTLSNWYAWDNNEVSNLSLLNVSYPKGCNYHSQNFNYSVPIDSILSVDYSNSQLEYGCEEVLGVILLDYDNENCFRLNSNSTCEINAPEGYFYLFENVKGEQSALYIEDTISIYQHPDVNSDFGNIQLSFPITVDCQMGLLEGNHGSNIVPVDTRSLEDEEDIRVVTETIMQEAIFELASSPQQSGCEYRLQITDINDLDCPSFMSGNRLCGYRSENDLWKVLVTKSGIGIIYYTTDTIKTFLNFCNDEDTSSDIKHTVALLKGIVNIDDCETAWSELNKITAISFFEESIVDIAPFSGLTNLESLKLYGNEISTINPDSFGGLNSLHTLMLSGNDITNLPANVFIGLRNLTKLYLSSNPLTSIEHSAFVGLDNLNYLQLMLTPLSSVEKGDFHGLTNLIHLALDHNQIIHIEPGAFEGLNRLQSFYFRWNPLTTIGVDVFNGLPGLISLYINANNIMTIMPGGFNGLDNLTSLYLIDNPLNSIEADTFLGLNNLRFLHLYDTQISSLEGGDLNGLTKLMELNVDSGVSISPDVFSDIPHSIIVEH